jgi:hypothetical protein
MAFVYNFSIFFEPSSRISDYIIFSLPRTIEGLWDLFEKLGFVKSLPYASNLIFAFSIALGLYLKQTDKDDTMPNSYKRSLNYIFGDVL